MRIIKITVNIIIYIFSLVLFRSRKYVIVGGWYGKRFADNSKGTFLYLNENKERLGIKKVFWYTNDQKIYEALSKKGYDVLYRLNVRSIFWHLRSAVHIVDQGSHDILGWLSTGAIKINMWHGIPLKSIGRDSADGIKGVRRIIIDWSSGGAWRGCFGVAPSDKASQLLSSGLGIDINKFLIMTYPRTLELYKAKRRSRDELYRVFYLPTFRDNGKKCPLLDLDLSEFNKKLRENSIVLKVKPHYADKADWEIVSSYSNIIILNAEDDVYDNLMMTDLLITDYSSVYFDFMITERPILFYCYDFEYYQKSDRGFLLDYDEYTPGEKTKDSSRLIDEILKIKNCEQQYRDRYEYQYKRINEEINRYNEQPNLEALDKIFMR